MAGVNGPAVCLQAEPGAEPVDAIDRGVLVNSDPESLDGVGEAPRQLRGIDDRGPGLAPQSALVDRRANLLADLFAVEQLDLVAVPPQRLGLLGETATSRSPVGSSSHSIPSRSSDRSVSAKFSIPSRSSSAISSGNRAAPLPIPWVKNEAMKPPLRPLAFAAIRAPSTTTTSLLGSSCLASTAAQSPLSPPPTIARSHSASAASGGRGSGRSGESSQNGVVTASA